MRSAKVLQFLNESKIDELRAILQDEVYNESLKNKPNAKKRYSYMKKYFNYHNSVRECLQKPCEIIFEDKPYTCFTNSWSLALTTEPTGEIELWDETNGKYPEVTRLIRFDGIKKKMNFGKIIAEAKSKGYRLTKTEVGPGFKYLMLYDDTYYKIGLIDATFGIIDDGELAMTYHPYGEKMPLTIKNDIGLCIIMPVYMHDGEPGEDKVVIEVN